MHGTRRSLTTLGVFILVWAGPMMTPMSSGAGANLYVTLGGIDVGDCRVPADPCASLAYAASRAASGDTIDVGPGTFTASLSVTMRSLSVQGSTSGSAGTILEPTTAEGTVFSASRGGWILHDVTIDGLSGQALSAGYGSTIDVVDSTITDGDPAVCACGPTGTIDVIDSTLAGNSVAATDVTSGYVTITASTVADNGVGLAGVADSYSVAGTILSANDGDDCSVGMIVDAGFNLDQDGTCRFSTAQHSQSGPNPDLGPLQNNGGPTRSMAPAQGSPALNQIPPGTEANSLTLCPGTDQRGVTRPSGQNCDLGAIEPHYATVGCSTSITCTTSGGNSASGQGGGSGTGKGTGGGQGKVLGSGGHTSTGTSTSLPDRGSGSTSTTSTTTSTTAAPVLKATSRSPTSPRPATDIEPRVGPPGTTVDVTSSAPHASCQDEQVLFDDQQIGSGPVSPPNHFTLSGMRIPGDAKTGRHRITISCDSSHEPVLAIAGFEVTSARDHLTAFDTSIPQPHQVAFDTSAIVKSALVFASLWLAALMIAVGFPAEWFNDVWAERRSMHRHRGSLLAARSARGRTLRGALFIAFLAAGGIFTELLDPGFRFDLSSLWFSTGAALGLAVITLVFTSATAIRAKSKAIPVRLDVIAGSVLVAAVCILASRLLHFEPGYMYGLIAGFVLLKRLPDEVDGSTTAISTVVIFVVSICAWVLSVPVTRDAARAGAGALLLVGSASLNVIFVAGLESLVFGLVPLPFLPGRAIWEWSWRMWLLIYSSSLLVFVKVLLVPNRGFVSRLAGHAFVPVLVPFAFFALVSIAFMLYSKVHPERARLSLRAAIERWDGAMAHVSSRRLGRSKSLWRASTAAEPMPPP